MSKIKAPMRAPNDSFDDVLAAGKVRWPMLASFKLDGWRGFVENGVVIASSGAPIVNPHVQELFGRPEYNGLDGELIVGAWNDPNVFNTTSKFLKRSKGDVICDVRFFTFDDRSNPSLAFAHRLQGVSSRINEVRAKERAASRLEWIPHVTIRDEHELSDFEENALRNRFEGVMLKHPDGTYKFGRATVNEGTMFKVKRFVHEEATIIDYSEQESNSNEAFLDDLGRTKRSERKEGRAPTGMVGSFVVESPAWPRPFLIGAGSLSHEEKSEAYAKFDEMYKGKQARFKYFRHGVKDVPRHGLFDGLRDPNDTPK